MLGSGSPSYQVAISYKNERKLFNIPVDFSVNELIAVMARVFNIEEGHAAFMYLKKCGKLLNGLVRLSQIVGDSPLVQEAIETNSLSQASKWYQLVGSQGLSPQNLISGNDIIELTMDVMQFAG